MTETKMAEIARAGGRIRYWTKGDAGAPAVVCMHGVTLDHGAFAAQVPALAAAGYRAVAWDMRGHGESRPAGDERFSIRLVAEDLGALLDAEGIDRAVLVGQSFGGSVAQYFHRLQPERVAALVLVGAPALGERMPRAQRIFGRARPFLLRLWPERHLRRTLPAFMSRNRDVREYVAEATRVLSKVDFIAVTEAALEGFSRYGPVTEVRAPVLVVHGENEEGWLVRMFRKWAARDARVRCAAVPDAGHLANQDNPAAFNELLIGFLRERV